MRSIIFHARVCWFCAAEDAMFLRFDKKKHRPFLSCEVCGTHAFLRTPQALIGLAIVTPVVEEMFDRMHSDTRFADEQRSAINNFNRELLAAMQPPAPASTDEPTTNNATFRDALEQKIRKE